MKTMRYAAMLVLVIGLSTAAFALEPTVITYDNGTEGWDANPDCETIYPDGGVPGAYFNFANRYCDGPFVVRAYFDVRTATNPAFIGDYTAKGPVRLSVDVNVNSYDFNSFFGTFAAEEFRQLVVEFIDHDNPYTDPATGYSWPWTSVIYPMGFYQSRDAGWKNFSVDIADPNATEVPEGWVGFGGPEDPNTYMPQLPPGVTFADVMAGVDEVVLHSIEPGYFYSIAFTHDIDFDNLSIIELPKQCNGIDATIFVDDEGYVHGGPLDGTVYTGELLGTTGNDVIVGTDGDDIITGHFGEDLICGGAGNDSINGQQGDDFLLGEDGDDTLIGQMGDDFIDGGDGRDVINGGQGINTCLHGEVVNSCGGGYTNLPNRRTVTRPGAGDRTTVRGETSGATTLQQRR